MAEQVFNGFLTSLVGDVAPGDLTITVADGSLAPLAGNYRLKVDNEIMLVTARVANVLTVQRGQEGTVAAAHNGTYSAAVVAVGLLTAASIELLIPQYGDPSQSQVYTRLKAILQAGAGITLTDDDGLEEISVAGGGGGGFSGFGFGFTANVAGIANVGFGPVFPDHKYFDTDGYDQGVNGAGSREIIIPVGKGGRFVIGFDVYLQAVVSPGLVGALIDVNNHVQQYFDELPDISHGTFFPLSKTVVLDLADGDAVAIYMWNRSSGNVTIGSQNNVEMSFWGYKLS